MQLIFATNNLNKIEEVQALLPSPVEIMTLREAGIHEDIEEPFDTFHENALAKARYIYNKTGVNCFAEDSGLCVDALHGAPGVYSARYAGSPSNSNANNQLLLEKLANVSERNAHYHSTIALIWNGEEYIFDGQCKGTIANQAQGTGGFGYDPLFIPAGHVETFGELPPSFKNSISHRKASVEKLVDKLKTLLQLP